MIEAVTLTVCALLAGAVQAQTKSWGWRGDGTGLFPDANPPVAWGRVSATLKDLTTQAEKPKGDEPGKNPAVLGNIPEWLVLGPIPYDAETSRKELLAKEFVPDEAKLAPAAGDKAGGVEWKKVSSTGAQLNLAGHYKDMSAKVFYAHAYIHSKNGGRVMLRLMGPTCQFRLNGQEVLSMEEANLRHMDKEVELKKGWNSLLVKVFTTRRKDYWALANNSPPDSGFFQVVLWGLSPGEQYESQGILWEASIPNAWQFSCAQPVVVGSRVIISTDPSFLICFDKLTGKRLWASYCGHSESATAEERQAKPDLFRQIDPKAARIKELASTWTGTLEQQVEYHDLAVSLARLMAQVDGKKYASASPAKSAGSGGLTSRTDGNFVYTWFSDGVSVCHDLDGKRKWMALENDGWPFSGGAPYITSPILTDREFVVAMKHTYAHDRETGKLLWTMPSKNYVWPPLNSAEPITAPGTPCINYELLGLYKPGVGWFPWSNATFAGFAMPQASSRGRRMPVTRLRFPSHRDAWTHCRSKPMCSHLPYSNRLRTGSATI